MRTILPPYAKRQRALSVSVSDRPTSTLTSAFGVAVLIAVVAVVGVVLRILGFEEPLAGRTLILVLVVAFGAFSSALIVAVLAHWITGGWPAALRAAVGAVLVGGAFVPATLFSFAIENRLIEGHVEAESIADLTSTEIFWSLFGAMGMFTPSGLKYLLPWPLLAVAVAAAVCFYLWPRRGQRIGVE
jgi:hypothetical protein